MSAGRSIRCAVALLLALSGVVSGALQVRADTSTDPPPPPAAYLPDEVVVQLGSSRDVSQIEQSYDLAAIDRVAGTHTYDFAVMDGTSVPDEVSQLQSDPAVVAAEPNYVVATPEAKGVSLQADPKFIGAHPSYIQQMYVDQWSAPFLGLNPAHTLSTGAGVMIAVIDTGVQYDHPELGKHLVPGFDFLENTQYATDPTGGPDSGHGTFIAGLLALVAPDARIMPIRALDPNGQGNEFDVADGIYYAVNHGANIINLSLGSYEQSDVINAAVNYAEQHDVLVVAAAGNDNSSQPEYPAATPGVVGVAATDQANVKADFSNYGPNITLSAPGIDLYSDYDDGTYAFGSGTSFAAPFVAGVAALAWSCRGDLGATGVIQTLIAESDSIDALNPDYAGQLGSGEVNANRALSDVCAPAAGSLPPALVGSDGIRLRHMAGRSLHAR